MQENNAPREGVNRTDLQCEACEEYDAYIETIAECLFEGIKELGLLANNIRRARSLSMKLQDKIRKAPAPSYGSGKQVGRHITKEKKE